jgi:hypothetical protein
MHIHVTGRPSNTSLGGSAPRSENVKNHQTRSWIKRTSLAAVAAGLLLTMGGMATPAGAQKPNTIKITLCHRTNAPTNPYRLITVSVDGSNGEIVGSDHTGHAGPAFDFSGETVYDTPRNGDQWGDIIPPYEYDGGSFPGMNWEEGAAIHEAGCQGAEEPEDPTCPNQGEVWTDANDNDAIDEGECAIPTEPQPLVAADLACATPAGMKVTLTNTGEVSGLVDITSGAALVHDDVVVPVGSSIERVVDVAEDATYDIDVVDVREFTGTRDCEEVEAVVIPKTPETPETPVVPAEQVAGIQVVRAQELPRTGNTTLPLFQVGLGLMLVGAGALLFGKDDTVSI